MQTLSPAQLAAHIDHTLLKPDASAAQIEKLCAEAREHRFFLRLRQWLVGRPCAAFVWTTAT